MSLLVFFDYPPCYSTNIYLLHELLREYQDSIITITPIDTLDHVPFPLRLGGKRNFETDFAPLPKSYK